MLEINKIHQGDCLELMKQIEDKSIDMILCDLPYGRTNLEWDKEISLERLWFEYKRMLKDNGIIILTSIQPFTSKLILSNIKMFKYELIWEKSRISNPLTNKKEPSKVHENILIFYNKLSLYNPQKFFVEEKYIDKRNSINNSNWGSGQFNGVMKRNKDTGERQPQSVIFFKSHWSKDMHPTQKPVALFEYLIKTYTKEGDLVLDNCIGSGTTAIACINTKRNFIGMELEQKYVDIANKRLEQTKLKVMEVKQEAMQSEARHSSQH